MNKHKSNKIKENSNAVRHLIMGQIITTQNLVAIKEVRHAGQSRKIGHQLTNWIKYVIVPKFQWFENPFLANHFIFEVNRHK